jgi:hypothetical protein
MVIPSKFYIEEGLRLYGSEGLIAPKNVKPTENELNN